MRVAIVHSFYSSEQPSGENRVAVDQARALMAAGHDVLLLGRHTDREQGRSLYPLRAATWVATGRGPDPTTSLKRFAPDIVHIHNLFPNISTHWVVDWAGPIVVSIHNYRAVCSNGLLYRDEDICTECPSHGNIRAVQHKCYRGSAIATLPLAISRPREGLGLLRRADAIVTTSSYSERTLRRLIPDLGPTTLIPNFGPNTSGERSGGGPSSWVSLGRFTPEKGFLDLVRMWPPREDLLLIGDGPQSAAISSTAANTRIRLSPSVPRDTLRSLLPNFTGLIFPSRWLEVAPQVVVEALAVGLPIVADERNGVAQLVHEAGLGATYRDAESLATALQTVREDRSVLRDRALQYFAAHYSQGVWTARMTNLYEMLLNANR